MKVRQKLTELDAGVLFTDVLALLVGEKHVGRQTTLGGVGVLDYFGLAGTSCAQRDALLRRV